MRNRYILSTLMAAFLCAGLLAQTPESVTVALNKNSIKNTTYPFDVPFFFKGKIPDNCTRIIFSYKVSEREKRKKKGFRKWISLPSRENAGQYFLSDDRPFRPSDGEFMILCRGLHPNIYYDFKFEVIKEPALDDKAKTEIRQKMSDKLVEFVKVNINGFGEQQLKELNDNLTKIIMDKVITDPDNQVLRKKNSTTPYSVNIRTELRTDFNNFTVQANRIVDATKNLKPDGLIKETTALFKSINAADAGNQFLKELSELLASKIPLTDASKVWLDINIAPALEGFKSYTLRNGLVVLKKLSQSPVLLQEIFDGQKKISNNDLVASSSIDTESIYFINEVISFLNAGNLTNTQAEPNNIMFRQLGSLAEYLNKTAAEFRTLADANAQIAAFTAKLPDLTADLLVTNSISTETITIPEVETQNTAYISIDGGLGYGSAFESVFSSYGANLYLSPVNKKARLSTFKGWNRFTKQFCFSLGVANQFGTRPENTQSILGSGSTDLYVGMGYRLGRIIKLNISGMPYTAVTNPITNRKTLKMQFFGGVGIDINLIGALGTLGKTLKITQ